MPFVLISALVAALVLVMPVAAQNPEAPHLSPETTTVYAHHTDGTDESVGWLNADAADPDSDDIAMGEGTGVTEQEWRLVLDPAPLAAVTLEGDVKVSAYIGGGTTVGAMEVSTELFVDGTSIGTGDTQNHPLTPADGEYPLVEWTIPVSAVIPAGGELAWTIHASGGGVSVFLGVHEDRGKSFLELPVTAVDPIPVAQEETVTYHDIDEERLGINLAWNGTKQTDQYNWTHAATDLSYFASGDVNGTVTVTLTDPNGTVALEETYTGDVNASTTLQGAAGTWNVTIVAEADGSLDLLIGPAVPGDGPDGGDGIGGDGDGDGDGGDGDGGPDNGTDEPADDEDSPAPALLLLPVLGLVAWLRRR